MFDYRGLHDVLFLSDGTITLNTDELVSQGDAE